MVGYRWALAPEIAVLPERLFPFGEGAGSLAGAGRQTGHSLTLLLVKRSW